MSKGFVFWLIFLIAVVMYVVMDWPMNRRWGWMLIGAVLIAILGWATFGAPIN